jgi:hypothetical protein
MKRRSFFKTLGGSAIALEASRAGSLNAGLPSPNAPINYAQVPSVFPGDAEAYFTDEKLHQWIDTGVSLQGHKFEVVCFSFPCWHPSPYMENIFGKGWTEWEILKRSTPLYPGHLFPKYPLWGYFNDAEPEWAAKEIDAASDSGIDVWMIDWYWHNGTQFYHEQLEQGFLKAPNRNKLKFAIAWANHPWWNQYPANCSTPDDAAILLPQYHSEEDMLRVTDYCIEHYFNQPNYWRIGGRPVFCILGYSMLLKFFSADELPRVFDKMRARVRHAGLGDLHFQTTVGYGGDKFEIRKLGFESATQYHSFGRYPKWAEGSRTPFGEAARIGIENWKDGAAHTDVPFFPDCPVGWDDSPRYGKGTRMVTQRTADQYARFLRAAQYFSAASPVKQKIIYLTAWNEWTEDHVLLPDTVYGYSYLDALRRVFRG